MEDLNRYGVREEGFVRQKRADEICAGDVMYFKSIAARQKLILEDLRRFTNRYPDRDTEQMIAALFSVYCWLDDKSQSIGFSAQKEVGGDFQ